MHIMHISMCKYGNQLKHLRYQLKHIMIFCLFQDPVICKRTVPKMYRPISERNWGSIEIYSHLEVHDKNGEIEHLNHYQKGVAELMPSLYQ